MNTALVSLVFALAVNEFVHNLFEVWGMRQKVSWLQHRMDGVKHKKWPIDINSSFKTLLIHLCLIMPVTGFTYLAVTLLNVDNTVLLWAATLTLVLSYGVTTFKVDKFHTEIGSLLNRYKGQ